MKNILILSMFSLKLSMVFGQNTPIIPCTSGLVTVSANVNSPELKKIQSTGIITSSKEINSGGSAIYTTTSTIKLAKGFHAKSGSKFHGYIANCSGWTCPAPTGLTSTPISETSVNISWNTNTPNDIDTWEIEVVPNSQIYTNVYKSYNGKLPYRVNNLVPGTHYKYKIRSKCFNSIYSGVVTGTFTTPLYGRESLIWNDSIKLRNWEHICEYESDLPYNQTSTLDFRPYNRCDITDFSDLTPGRIVTNEIVKCSTGFNDSVHPTDNTGSMLVLDSVNFRNDQYLTSNPITTNQNGFRFDIVTNNSNLPIEFNIYNQHNNVDTPEKRLHEVGFVFNHWGDNNAIPQGKWAFRESYNINDYDENIEVKFLAKINNYQKSPSNDKSQFISSDLRLVYFDKITNKAKVGLLIGVLVFEDNVLYKLPEDPILWTDGEAEIFDGVPYYKILIRGKLANIEQFTSQYKEFTINYKEFLSDKYLRGIKNIGNVLPLLSTYDPIIKGIDVYSHTEGLATLNISLKTVRINGLNVSVSRNGENVVSEKNILKNEKTKKFNVFPNPNDGIFKIKIDDTITIGNIVINDLLGNSIVNIDFKNENELELNLQNYPKGIYFVKLISDNQTYTSKIIKN